VEQVCGRGNSTHWGVGEWNRTMAEGTARTGGWESGTGLWQREQHALGVLRETLGPRGTG
jgi:hypothetical protein